MSKTCLSIRMFVLALAVVGCAASTGVPSSQPDVEGTISQVLRRGPITKNCVPRDELHTVDEDLPIDERPRICSDEVRTSITVDPSSSGDEDEWSVGIDGESRLLRRAGSGAPVAIGVRELREGDEVAVWASSIAESLPPQAQSDVILVTAP